MVITEAYYSGGYKFDARQKPIFDSRVTKYAFITSGDLNFVILVEDSDTSSPNAITVRMPHALVLST